MAKEKPFNQEEYVKEYQKKTYKKYSVVVRKDESLFYDLEKYKNNTGSISELIKTLLGDYFVLVDNISNKETQEIVCENNINN